MTTSPDLMPGVDTSIYGMPAFATIAVPDLDRTVSWFTGALDFVELFRMPPGGPAALVHLRRWRYQDVLVRPSAPGETFLAGGVALSFAADAEELDAFADRARSFGGGTVEGPIDTPWNTRDVRVTSPDGLSLVFTARRPEAQRDAAFESRMRDWSAEQGVG